MKLDVNEILSKVEMDGQIYYAKESWKKFFIFAGVLICLFIITIPFGIWIILVVKKSRVGLTDDGFVFKGIGSFAWCWEDIEEFGTISSANMVIHGGGVAGVLVGSVILSVVAVKIQGLKGLFRFKIKGKGWKFFFVHIIVNSY